MYSRHDLVWLTPEGWDAAAQAANADRDAVELWRREGWPAVVRRADALASPDTVSLGIAMPPDATGSKRRIALRVQASHVAKHRPPLPLGDAIGAAPSVWRNALSALAAAAPGLRVYGSLSFQSLTGQRYLTDTSDIDLLATPTMASALARTLALLTEHAQGLPLDGEIVFPSGDAVAWKEWRNAVINQARVLVKSLNAVRLADLGSLAATLEAT